MKYYIKIYIIVLYILILYIHIFTNIEILIKRASSNGWVGSLFGPNKAIYSSHNVSISKPPVGLYLWGGAGCGKTYLMDLFFESLQIDRKRRVHFNNFMIDVHKRIHRLKGQRSITFSLLFILSIIFYLNIIFIYFYNF